MSCRRMAFVFLCVIYVCVGSREMDENTVQTHRRSTLHTGHDQFRDVHAAAARDSIRCYVNVTSFLFDSRGKFTMSC